MLKKVPVSQLRVGMFVSKIDAPWLDHPFWRTSFVIQDLNLLQKVRESGVSEVWIDTSKGGAVEAPPAPQPGAVPASPGASEASPARPGRERRRTSTLQEELVQASKVMDRAREEMLALFEQARFGQVVDPSRYNGLVQDISDSVRRNPNALISLARLKTKDEYTYMHSVAVSALMMSLGRELGLPERDIPEVGLAGLLHDIGKVTIPLDILNKPDRLSDDEYASVKHHPQAGHEMLRDAGLAAAMALDVCLHHHERIDGKGYPHGLLGPQISLAARMGAICDVYDAISSDRPYKKAWDPAECLRRMANWTDGGQFDSVLFENFVRCVGIYPTGSLVRLQSNRLAVVLDQNHKDLLKPRVKAFYSIDKRAEIKPQIIDLVQAGSDESIVSPESPAQWGFDNLTQWWLDGR